MKMDFNLNSNKTKPEQMKNVIFLGMFVIAILTISISLVPEPVFPQNCGLNKLWN